MIPATPRPSTVKLLAAFGAIYFLWGSNFLAIRYAAESMPPFLMMGVRCLIAGSILFAWGWFRGGARPTTRQWIPAWAVGTLLFLGCHGLLAFAEQTVPSGIAALVLATIPVWMTLLDWATGAPRPTVQAMVGLALGLLGLVVLVGPGTSHAAIPFVGVAVLVVSSFAWGAGSILSRRVSRPENLILASGMQLFSGGISLVVTGLLVGELARVDARVLETKAVLGFAYMIILSSLVGFTAYMWLLRVSTPTLVGTYAFVNPIVALFVGWALAGEMLDARTLWATMVIVVGVALIVTAGKRIRKEEAHDRPPVEGTYAARASR